MELLNTAGAVMLVAVVATGCSLSGRDKPTEPQRPIDFSTLSHDTSLLLGSWVWQRSTYYFTADGTPFVQTPRSTGRMKRLVFTTDDSVRVYLNDELVRAMSYEDYLGQGHWGVRDDLFVMSTVASDGPETVYQRME